MKVEAVVQTIQLAIAPTVMISSCSLVQNVLYGRTIAVVAAALVNRYHDRPLQNFLKHRTPDRRALRFGRPPSPPDT